MASPQRGLGNACLMRLLTAEGALNMLAPKSVAESTMTQGDTLTIGSSAAVASVAMTAAMGRPPDQRSQGPAHRRGAASVARPSAHHSSITSAVLPSCARTQAITKVM